MKFGDMYTRAAQTTDFQLVSAEDREVILESSKNERPQTVEEFFDWTVVFYIIDNNKIIVEVTK